VKGEHAGRRERAESPLVQRALDLTRGGRTRHRPRLGVMSTSLLNELMTDHLDAGYAAAARRRGEAGADTDVATGGGRRSSNAILAVGLLLVGFLLAVAFRDTLRQAPESERARQALVHDVETGSASGDALQARAEALAGQLVRERDAALSASETGDRVTGDLRRLEAAAAQRPMKGPGIQVIVGDATPRDELDASSGERVTVPADDTGRLRDRDLQSLVNALWAAGAEAIAVNGERLAPTTTIRAAGEAILVDLRPVQSPYTLDALGDPDRLLPRFAGSDAAGRYQSYTGLYGITFQARKAAELTLRAATGPDLRYAQPSAPGSSAAPVPSRPSSSAGGSSPSAGGSPTVAESPSAGDSPSPTATSSGAAP
jgi:uncharacterized protein YlxW (UPF0749 family)